MNRARGWATFFTLAPLSFGACEKPTEPPPSDSQRDPLARRTPVTFLDSFGLAIVVPGDTPGPDSGGFGTCSENAALFTACEVPGGPTIHAGVEPDAATPLTASHVVTLATDTLSATEARPIAHADGQGDATEVPIASWVASSNEGCGRTEPVAPTPPATGPSGSSTPAVCSCGTDPCMCG
jgi:hypothetical protein